MKKRPPFNENAAVRSAIRRVFSRSPIVREIMWKVRREVPKYNKDGSRAKKDAVQYQCGVCQTWTKSTAISVDHIEPVISVEVGFQDWNTFVSRLFCGHLNLQVICDDCHQKKTNKERFERQLLKDNEMIAEINYQILMDADYLRKNSKEIAKAIVKFTPKKLLNYGSDPDLVDHINRLKQQLKSIKNASKSLKGKYERKSR